MRRSGGLCEVARTGEAPIILWTPIYGHDGCVGYRAKSIIGDPPVFFMVASMASKGILALVEDHAPTQRTRRSCPDRRAAYHTLDADLRPRRVCRIPSEKYHRRPACVFMVASMASRRILALIKDHATIRRTLRSCPDRRGAYHTLDADLRPRRVCRIPSEKYHRRPACVLYGSEHGQQRDISAGRGSCDDPADSAKLPGQASRLSYFGRRFTATTGV